MLTLITRIMVPSTLVCENGTLRLWSSFSATPPGEGMLQICVSNIWRVVCDDYWDCDDATVACRQLGYTGNGIVLLTHLIDVQLFTHFITVF